MVYRKELGVAAAAQMQTAVEQMHHHWVFGAWLLRLW